jgi:hypothetical protein
LGVTATIACGVDALTPMQFALVACHLCNNDPNPANQQISRSEFGGIGGTPLTSPPPLSQSDWQVRIDRVGIAGRTWDEWPPRGILGA